jgi:alkylation response protein AidB-like acyl-CoA dehydrogenase
MELLLSEEQTLLRDSAAKLLAQGGGVKRARALRGKSAGFDRGVHREIAAAGWLSMLVPAEHGGLGLGPTELALVLGEAGRVLAPEPVASCALAAWTLARGGGAVARDALLGPVMAGELVVVPAFAAERIGVAASEPVKAVLGGDGAKLTGSVDFVPVAGEADGFLVEASAGGQTVLCHVEASAADVRVSRSATVDGRVYGRIDLDGATVQVVAGPDNGRALVETLYTLALVAASAEMLGVMSAAHEATVAYLKERHQFGRPIGSFQALQHRAVDDYAAVSSTSALLFQLCAQGEAISPAMASALKAFASRSCLAVTKSAIQMHGAIGFTDEHDIGLYLKRAMWLSAYLGNETAHVRRFMQIEDSNR